MMKVCVIRKETLPCTIYILDLYFGLPEDPAFSIEMHICKCDKLLNLVTFYRLINLGTKSEELWRHKKNIQFKN